MKDPRPSISLTTKSVVLTLLALGLCGHQGLAAKKVKKKVAMETPPPGSARALRRRWIEAGVLESRL